MPLSSAKRREKYAAEKAARPKKRLPRRRCLNCDAGFPLTRKGRKFCSPDCQKEYNRFGGAFGPLKRHMEKLIKRMMREQLDALRAEFTRAMVAERNERAETVADLKHQIERLRVKLARAAPDTPGPLAQGLALDDGARTRGA